MSISFNDDLCEPEEDDLEEEWEGRMWTVWNDHPDRLDFDGEFVFNYVQLDAPIKNMMATRFGLVVETCQSLLLITGQDPSNFMITKLR